MQLGNLYADLHSSCLATNGQVEIAIIQMEISGAFVLKGLEIAKEGFEFKCLHLHVVQSALDIEDMHSLRQDTQ